MFSFRPFRNSDPPSLVQVWRAQSPMRGLMQPLSVAILEHTVLSKPYFDRAGLIVAEDDGRVVGFVHCGFGGLADGSDIDPSLGVICMLQVLPEWANSELAVRLVEEAETFLRSQGVREVVGGGCAPNDPFYLGLYGGSNLPGVLAADLPFTRALLDAGYQSGIETIAYAGRCTELSFPYDRQHRIFNRDFLVDSDPEYQLPNWWLSCTLGQTQYTCYQLIERPVHKVHCSVVGWDMEPLATSWGVQATGLTRLECGTVEPSLLSFFLVQMLRLIQASGVSIVEVQSPPEGSTEVEFLLRFGFQEVSRGRQFHKTIETAIQS